MRERKKSKVIPVLNNSRAELALAHVEKPAGVVKRGRVPGSGFHFR